MTGESKGWVRASTALDSSYEAESSLLRDLEKADESNRGKLLRALVRAGFKASRNNASAASAQAAQTGGGHGQS
jgi:hypothetical protein